MKNIKFILINSLIILGFNCQAQSPIIDINNKNGEYINGAYYKDVNNLLNQFEGTYVLNDWYKLFKNCFSEKNNAIYR